MPDLIVQGYLLQSVIPECPTNKKQILFWDKDIDEQYWRPPYQLTDHQFLKLSYDEQEEIVETENERCLNGCWFYNHGVPTYLTNDNYHFLSYHRIDGRIVPDFIQFQTIDYYFQKLCELDDNCFGRIDLKPRREGDTQRKLATAINRVITNESFFVGIQSKTGKDASEINFGGLILAYNKLPIWRKPKTRLDNPSRELAFEQPPKRSSSKVKTLQEVEYEDYYLNSRVNWRATSSDGYDGDKLHIYIQDEYFKWMEADAHKAYYTHKKCLVDGEDIIGKAYLLSTVGIEEEEEKVSEEAILNGVKLWNESNVNERNSLGQTKTGLYPWFIPAYSSRRSKRRGWPDKYGFIPEDEVKKVLFARRDDEKDPQQKMIIIRQEPMNVQEALTSMIGGLGTFDNVRLGARHTYLTEEWQPTDQRPVKYVECNLAWKNNEKFTDVVINKSENPRFRLPYLPNVFGEGTANRVKKLAYGGFMPFSDTQGVIGADTFAFEKTMDAQNSKGALQGRWKYNFHNPYMSNIYFGHYLHRPATPDMFAEDALMLAWLYGAFINGERKAANALFHKWFKDNNCYGFLMHRPEITKNSGYQKRDNERGVPTSGQTIEIGCGLWENYIAAPHEEDNENEKDNLEYYWDEISLDQAMKFDPKKSTRYDAMIATFLAEIGAQSLRKYKAPPEQKESDSKQPTVMDYLIPAYQRNSDGSATPTIRRTKLDKGFRNNQRS